jgi:hypothetical protein
VNSGVRATGATAVPIFDRVSQAAIGAHSICTIIGPSVRNQSRADWLVTSPTAIPCGSRFVETAAGSAKGLPGGSPSRDAAAQLERETNMVKKRRNRGNGPIMAMDLPEREQGVKIRLIENQSFRLAY